MTNLETDLSHAILSFPVKLFALLEQEGEEVELIQWASHGYCFRITQPERFAEEIVPKYFKQTKLTSFQRQLNLYGFRRIARGPDQGCYFHPKFQKNRRDLLPDVKRLPGKGTLPSYEQFWNSLKTSSSLSDGSKGLRVGSMSSGLKIPASIVAAATRKASLEPTANKIAVDPATTIDYEKSFSQIPSTHQAPSLHPPSISVPPAVVPRTMSKLTMNIGFGRNVFPSQPAPTPNFIISTGSANPVVYKPMNTVADQNVSANSDMYARGVYSTASTLSSTSVDGPVDNGFSMANYPPKPTTDFLGYYDANGTQLINFSERRESVSSGDMFEEELDMLELFAEDTPHTSQGYSLDRLSPATM
eukprot:gene3606-2598_t